MKEKEFFENRADLLPDSDPVSDNTCDHCEDPLLFAMQDKYHQFSLGLFTILQCLKIAENEGVIPLLPPDWWWSVESRYQQNLHLLE